MGEIIGIDLGTTYSAVAAMNRFGKPEVLPNRDGERITPSAVLFNGEDSVLVGSTAKRSAPAAPLDVVQFVKRQMGNPDWRFETSAGQQFTPEEISAIVLRRLKEDAEAHLGRGPVTDAVITVPAYFDDARRRATRHAGEIAGLNVLRVLNEPTAAALAFGLDTAAVGTYVVFDLGGGTFDVTVLRIRSGAFDVLTTDGLHELGGVDWDNRLMTLLNKDFVSRGGRDLMEDFGDEADLREKTELAKRALSQAPSARVALSSRGTSVILTVERSSFEAATADLVNQTRDMTQSVVEEAGLAWSQIDGVLLAGGATRMPMIRAMLQELSGKPATRSGNPDELVALGAAIQAGIEAEKRPAADIDPPVGVAPRPAPAQPGQPVRSLPPVRASNGAAVSISDVTSHGLGTIALDERGEPRNVVLIPRNSKIPSKVSEVFTTVTDRQADVRVIVTEGDDENPDYVRKLGPARGQAFAIPPYPAGARVRVAYAYDIDQTIHVEVTDVATNSSLGSFEIDNSMTLRPDEVEAAREKQRGIAVD